MYKKCIICGANKDINDFNIEHIIPESLGNKKLKITDVCKNCNSVLGSTVDCHITTGVLFDLLRNANNIKGKSGHIPNPFKEGTDEYGNKIRLDNNFKPTLVSNKRCSNDKKTITYYASNKTELKLMLDKDISKGLYPPKQVEAINKNFEKITSLQIHPKIYYDFKINLSKTEVSIIKIAYEYACLRLGNNYFDECAKELRNVLCLAMENRYIHCMLIGKMESNIYNKIQMLKTDGKHFIYLKKINEIIVIYISLFLEQFLSFRVIVSKSGDTYNISDCIEII